MASTESATVRLQVLVLALVVIVCHLPTGARSGPIEDLLGMLNPQKLLDTIIPKKPEKPAPSSSLTSPPSPTTSPPSPVQSIGQDMHGMILNFFRMVVDFCLHMAVGDATYEKIRPLISPGVTFCVEAVTVAIHWNDNAMVDGKSKSTKVSRVVATAPPTAALFTPGRARTGNTFLSSKCKPKAFQNANWS